MPNQETRENLPWKLAISSRQRPVLRRSVWQLINTFIPYFALWGLMIWALSFSYWITLALAIPAAGLLARIFIIFHDCAHGSFLGSPRANRILGFLAGVLTFTPYDQWRHKHSLHHATSGDLDSRGNGDIWTLTVREYQEASRWKRFSYRLFRNPLVLFVLAPAYLFLIHHRLPSRRLGKREKRSVHLTNAALLAIVALAGLTIGIKSYLLIQGPVILFAGMAGVWLFYVQHQFDGVYWERRPNWCFTEAALRGSSFYRLPKVLQWFSGNIGFHHIHHLSPAIPNYSLQECHAENPVFQKVKAVTLWSSLSSLSLRLWDEQRKKLVGFGQLRSSQRSVARSQRF